MVSKEEWKQIEEALKSLYHTVKLKADDFEIDIMLQRTSVYKNHLMLYVGGTFKGVWLIEDCEERRRFVQCKQHFIMSAKERENFKKLSKKLQKEYAEFYERRYDTYSLYWSSFGALKKHLITNNESIELIKIV